MMEVLLEAWNIVKDFLVTLSQSQYRGLMLSVTTLSRCY